MPERARDLREIPTMSTRPESAKPDGAVAEGPISVCLFWLHPLVRSEFERTLASREFELLTRRLDPKFDAQRVSIPETAVYVVDGSFPRSSSESLVAAILARNSAARIVAVAESFDEESAFPLLRLGVKGLVTFAEVARNVPWALREVAEGGYWVPRALLSSFIETALSHSSSRALPAGTAVPDPNGLTRREREVLNDLLENSSNKEIARRHHVSERTAKFHVSNVLSKYGVRRRADLILLAYSARKES